MANTTTNHDDIRRWAESKGGKPAAVDRTHHDDDVGIIRLMFPDNAQSDHQSLVEISWDEFFEQFEASQLALVYDEDSLFSKIIGRDTAEHRAHGEHTSRHHPASKPAAPDDDDRAAESDAGSDDRSSDLASRAYTDARGEVHHHTRTYEQQHGKS